MNIVDVKAKSIMRKNMSNSEAIRVELSKSFVERYIWRW